MMTSELLRPVKRTVTIFAIILMAELVGIGDCAAASSDSGAALESAKPPPISQQEKKAPEIVVEGINSEPPERGGQQKITVRAFRFSGEPPVPEDKLLSLVSGEVGREMTLDQLNALTEKVTEYLQ